jgi:hypothetical protein
MPRSMKAAAGSGIKHVKEGKRVGTVARYRTASHSHHAGVDSGGTWGRRLGS